MDTPPQPEIEELLLALDEAYDHNAWHGPNLRSCFYRLTVEQALYRPTAGRPNLWEICLHCAYWKYVVWRKVAGNIKRGAFPRKGSDSFPRESGTLAEWKADLALLDELHANLRQAVASLDPARLRDSTGGKYSLDFYIRGAALHDVYHAGQAQWIKLGR